MYESIRYIHSGKFTSRNVWRHQERVIDSYEFIIVTSGTVYIQLDGLEYILTKGDVLRIDPGVRHGGTRQSNELVGFFWVHFITDAPEELPPRYFRPESSVQAELLCRQILHYANTEGYPPESTDCLLRLLVMELTSENRRAILATDKLYSDVREWVRVNCDLPIKVADVAAHFGYNEDYIGRVFRKYYPDGLKAYIDAKKMDRIKNDLINGSLSLQDMAVKYGFSDYKYFLKYFKYHAGVSPTVYKQIYYNIHTNNR